jgi:hypothetical protein
MKSSSRSVPAGRQYAMLLGFALSVLLPTALASPNNGDGFNSTDVLKLLPKCAIDCVLAGISANGCALDDFACQCSKLGEMTKTVSPCLVNAGCDLNELADTVSDVADACEQMAPPDNSPNSDADNSTGRQGTDTDGSGGDSGSNSRTVPALLSIAVLVATVASLSL